jgi:Ner family transcriptional regulator
MTHLGPLKKPAEQKQLQDWHWADVLAGLRKRGWSLKQIGEAEGYAAGNTLGNAARHPYPKAEATLARYLGVDHPMEIWPSRYDSDGHPNRRMGRAPMRGQAPRKATTAPRQRNRQTEQTA